MIKDIPLEIEDIKQTSASKLLIFAMCAAIALTTLGYGTVHQPIIALFYVCTGLIAGLWTIDAFLSGVFRFNRTLLQIPLIALIGYGVLQIIPFGWIGDVGGVSGVPRTISLDVFATKNVIIQLTVFAVWFAVFTAYLDNSARIKKIVYFLIIFGFGFAFFAILQSLLSPTKIYGIYEPFGYSRPFGSFVSPNNFAGLMEMLIMLPLGLLFSGAIEREKRLLFVTAIVLMGISIVMSGSRGGLVSLSAGVIFLAIFATKNRSSAGILLKVLLGIGLLAVIIGGTILIGGESSLTRIAETAASKDPSTSRLHIWSITWEIIKSHWFFGAGLGAFGAAYTPFDSLSGMERAEQAHNDFLQVIADAGIIGATIGIFFLFVLFRTGFRNLKTHHHFKSGVCAGALAACFAVLVHSLFDFVLHTNAIALLFLMMISLVVTSGKNEAESEIHDNIRRKKRKKKATVTPIEKGRKKKEIEKPKVENTSDETPILEVEL